MSQSAKGWLQEICQKVDSGIADQKSVTLPGYEESLYRMVQPSGIMYGHPVKGIGGTGLVMAQPDPVNKMKYIFAESLIRTGGLSLGDHRHKADLLVPEIAEYFLNLYPELYQGNIKSYLDRPYYLAETLITKRITVRTSLMKNYLANLFHNSLLFLDVYLFGEWIRGMGSIPTSTLRFESASFRVSLLGIMALAAGADSQLQKEEKALFEFYLESSGLDSDMSKKARVLLNQFGKLSEVDIPQVDSWLVRKYLLEIAVLVTLADREINQQEQEFLLKLGEELQFSQEEVSTSMLAVESFVLDNWEAMHYLLGRSNLEVIGNRFMIRLKQFIDKNKLYVVQEIRESKELFQLLGKSRTEGLTDVEKRIVNEQLMDILKTIPAFVIIALPFTFITLPTLLALLPKSAFPSSFQE
jgi:hypothetical protein